MVQREKDLHQHMFRRIGVVYAEVEAFSCAVHELELTSAAEEMNAQVFQRPVKRQMPLDPVWDAVLQQCIPDPFKFRRDQMFF